MAAVDDGACIHDNNAADVRIQMWPYLVVLLGPPLVPFGWPAWWLCGGARSGGRCASSLPRSAYCWLKHSSAVASSTTRSGCSQCFRCRVCTGRRASGALAALAAGRDHFYRGERLRLGGDRPASAPGLPAPGHPRARRSTWPSGTRWAGRTTSIRSPASIGGSPRRSCRAPSSSRATTARPERSSITGRPLACRGPYSAQNQLYFDARPPDGTEYLARRGRRAADRPRAFRIVHGVHNAA